MTFGTLYLDNGSRIKYSHMRKFRKLYKKNRKRIVKEKGVKVIDINTWIKIREETFSKKKKIRIKKQFTLKVPIAIGNYIIKI